MPFMGYARRSLISCGYKDASLAIKRDLMGTGIARGVMIWKLERVERIFAPLLTVVIHKY